MSFIEDQLLSLKVQLGLLGESDVSDEELTQTIYNAAWFVVFDCGFEYQVNLSLLDISPDPHGDYNFEVLTSLKAAELFTVAELRGATLSSGATVKLGPSSITTSNASDKAKLAKSFADQYQDAKRNYLCGQAGSAILSPAVMPQAGLP